ncbi:MAG: DUF389 domain-containing protein, partial [Chloroflexi bacterium]
MPITTPEEIAPLLAVAGPCALAWGGELLFLHVQARWGEHAEGGTTPLLEAAMAQARAMGVTARRLFRTSGDTAQAIRQVVHEEEVRLLVMGWQGETRGGRSQGSARQFVWYGRDAVAALMADPPCDMAVMRLSTPPERSSLRRLLVPTAGGPNAVLAARIAYALARHQGGQATVLAVVQAGANPLQRQAAREAIRSTLAPLAEELEEEAASPGANAPLSTQLIEAVSPTAGILKAAGQGYDAILIGASREGVINRVLFGEVPRQVARRSPIPVIIVKRRLGPALHIARRTWDRIFALFPTLSEEERWEVFREVRRSARATTDFSVMISLSATIAALGLLLNSPALVIGAMLVAPLMSSIVGLGLAITLGDAHLLRLAIVSTLRGVLLASGVGFLIGLLVPDAQATAEVLARTRPTLLDLGVALASGAAGAYALCRKEVSSALPGVAIAASLVPPLAAAGIGLALGNGRIAGGAFLLFATNLVAIAAAGGTTFLLLGFKPEPEKRERQRLFGRGVVGIVTLLVAISLPLGLLTYRSVTEARLHQTVQEAVRAELAVMPGVTLEEVQIKAVKESVLHLQITVRATRPVDH